MKGNWEFLLLSILPGASEIVQQVKALTAKLWDLS